MNRLYIKIYLITLLPFILFIGCKSTELPQSTQIREAVHSMFKDGWNNGNIESFNRTIADSVLFHYSGSPQLLARDEMSEFVIRWRESFPDLDMQLEELLVDQDMAATRLTLTGTHLGPWAGADPTGEQVQMSLMMFFRFEDGKLVELWEVDDQLSFRKQLGLIP